MGTSSRHDGPKGKGHLLPEGYDPEEKKREEKKSISSWKKAKTDMTRYINGKTKKQKVVSSYIKARGGAKKVASSSVNVKKTTIILGNFLSNISKNGIQSFLKENLIQYENRNVEDVLSDIANLLSPPGDTKEDSAIRDAMLNIMGELYDNIIESGGNIESLNNVTSEFFNEIMNNFISEIIFQQLMKDLGSRQEISKKSYRELAELEKDIKFYIQGTVINVLSEQNYKELDYSDQRLNRTIEELYQECYEVLEGAI